MKNTIIINVIGTNLVYAPSGYLSFPHRDTCDIHFKIRHESRPRHTIITYATAFVSVPEKLLPVYPDCQILIVNPDIQETYTTQNVTMVRTFDDAIALVEGPEQKVYILANKALHEQAITNYKDSVSSIEVITCDKDFEGTDTFADPNPLEWSPVITREEKVEDKKVLDYHLHSWKNRYMEF